LLQINALGTKGYQIRDLQQKITQQETAQKQLEIQSSGLKSITRIQTQAQAMNFVPATGVSYIKDGDFALNQ
jgi:cell division protein FtsL